MKWRPHRNEEWQLLNNRRIVATIYNDLLLGGWRFQHYKFPTKEAAQLAAEKYVQQGKERKQP